MLNFRRGGRGRQGSRSFPGGGDNWDGERSYVIASAGVQVSVAIKVLNTCCAIALQTRTLHITNANEAQNYELVTISSWAVYNNATTTKDLHNCCLPRKHSLAFPYEIDMQLSGCCLHDIIICVMCHDLNVSVKWVFHVRNLKISIIWWQLSDRWSERIIIVRLWLFALRSALCVAFYLFALHATTRSRETAIIVAVVISAYSVPTNHTPNTNPIPDPTVTLKIIIRMHNVLSRLLCMVSRNGMTTATTIAVSRDLVVAWSANR